MAKTREQAGQWLDRERERRGISVREMSQKLDVAVQTIYDWQNGRNTVNDARAEQIAELFGADIIAVRRGLGLWVPDDRTELLADQTLGYDLDALRANALELLEQIEEVISRHVGHPHHAAERAEQRREVALRSDADHDRLRQGIADQAEDLRTELDEPKESDTDQAL